MPIQQGHPTIHDIAEGSSQYRYVHGKGIVLFAKHDNELYSLRLQKSSQPKAIDKISGRTLAQGETTLVSATITSETNITGNYVATVTGGAGIVSTGATTGEDIDHSLSVDIDELSALSGTGLHQTQDHFMFSDNGTEKKITFSNLEDAIFGNVSSDILIAAGGAATIQANAVALGTDTTGNYVSAISAGTGLASTGATSGETIGHTLSVDLTELTIGTGLTPASATTLNLDLTELTISSGLDTPSATTLNLDLTEVIASDANNKLLTSDGDGTLTAEANLSFTSSTLTLVDDGKITSSNFSSGFTGNGWKIDDDTTVTATFDDLLIRGTLTVYEMVIQQIRATNGSIIVSSSAKVDSVANYASGSDNIGDITFESTVSGTLTCPFVVGDIIMMQRVNVNAFVDGGELVGGGDIVSKKVYTVTGINQNVATTGDAGFVNGTAPVKGDEFVRIGSTSDANRQGILYLTSDDQNAPFIDVKDGVSTYALWHDTSTTKVRTGKLSGITDVGVNSGAPLTGYGMYANNIFLKGEINSTTGLIGSNADGLNGWSIAESRLSSTDGFDGYLTVDGANDYVALGSTTSASDISLTSTGASGTGMTICGWIYFPTLNVSEYIFVNNTQGANWSGINLYKGTSNTLSLLWGDGSGSGSGDYERMHSDGTFSAATWTFFAITTDFSLTTTDTKIWLGAGSTLTSQTVAGSGTSSGTTPVYGTGTAAIGREIVGTDSYGEFRMKKIALWNEELTAAEVTALFNGGNQVSWGTNVGNYTSSANLVFHSDYTTGSKNDLTGNIANATITLESGANIVEDNQVLGLVQANQSAIKDINGEALSSFYAGASNNTGASAAISFGSDGKIRGNGIYVRNDIDYLITSSRIFGNGGDGNCSLIAGTNLSTVGAFDSHNSIANRWVLTRDAYCDNLTIAAGLTIGSAGYRIFVRNTLDISAGSGILIRNNGVAGSNGSTSTVDEAGGAGGSGGGAGGSEGSLRGGVAGGNGGAGGAGGTSGSTTGVAGSNGSSTSRTNVVNAYDSNAGASGGAGSSSGGAGGTSSAPSGTEGTISMVNSDLTYIIAMRDIFAVGDSSPSLYPASGSPGGGGGGGGGYVSGDDGHGGGGGGQGGGSGGHVMVCARIIVGTQTNLELEAKGGDGGNGGNHGDQGGSGSGGVGGGGNGGDGGCVTIISGTDPDGVTIDVAYGAVGVNGSTGSSGGTPAVGIAGTSIVIHC